MKDTKEEVTKRVTYSLRTGVLHSFMFIAEISADVKRRVFLVSDLYL